MSSRLEQVTQAVCEFNGRDAGSQLTPRHVAAIAGKIYNDPDADGPYEEYLASLPKVNATLRRAREEEDRQMAV